jgi:putative selenate reductase
MPTTDDLTGLIMERAHREYRVPLTFTPLTVRNNFNETSLTYTIEEAQAEANRCIDCDTICSLCVGVCPNIALMTYKTDAFVAELPELVVNGGTLVETGSTLFSVDQAYQIAVLTDFCNECGNCVTACPTSGKPYEDKPRLYLNQAEFDDQQDNAFMMVRNADESMISARFAGQTHRLSITDAVNYMSPSATATFDNSFNLLSSMPGKDSSDGDEVSFEPAAIMFALWKGLDESMPEIPVADDGGTRISEPALT